MTNITIRTDDEIAKQIAELARAMDRPKNWVIEDALKQYLAEQSWQIEGIKQAQSSLSNAAGVAFEPVINKLRKKIRRKQTRTS